MNVQSFARITLGAAILAESGMALHRFEARRRGFEAAARRASALGRPLVVVGDPDAVAPHLDQFGRLGNLPGRCHLSKPLDERPSRFSHSRRKTYRPP